jgi:hypothetical protein
MGRHGMARWLNTVRANATGPGVGVSLASVRPPTMPPLAACSSHARVAGATSKRALVSTYAPPAKVLGLGMAPRRVTRWVAGAVPADWQRTSTRSGGTPLVASCPTWTT